MKKLNRKIHWPTKYISNKNYVQEVSIDGKQTNRFNFKIGYYELYVAQVIRSGNCLTLLSSPINFALENFKNAHLLDDIVKYVFWTFNKNFLQQLTDCLSSFTFTELKTIQNLLEEAPSAYHGITEDDTDEELVWCMVKNNSLKADDKFALMYEKDAANRKTVLDFVYNRILEKENVKDPVIELPIYKGITFPDMLLPLDGSIQSTLEYIQSKITEAQFPHNIFIPLAKDKKGRNLIGVNSEIAAMISCFQKKGYFKPGFTFKDIFRAFGIYSKNSAGKEYDFASFEGDFNFKKYTDRLLSIKIEQLNPSAK